MMSLTHSQPGNNLLCRVVPRPLAHMRHLQQQAQGVPAQGWAEAQMHLAALIRRQQPLAPAPPPLQNSQVRVASHLVMLALAAACTITWSPFTATAILCTQSWCQVTQVQLLLVPRHKPSSACRPPTWRWSLHVPQQAPASAQVQVPSHQQPTLPRHQCKPALTSVDISTLLAPS